ncbi:hypothetical protein RBB50_011755 [Rhinocladiella similis]
MTSAQPQPIVPADHNRTMDWIGTVAIIGVTVAVLLSLDFGGVVSPWNSPKFLALLIGGCVLAVFFVFWEARGASNPLMPLYLLNRPSKLGPLMVCFVHGFVGAHTSPVDSHAAY